MRTADVESWGSSCCGYGGGGRTMKFAGMVMRCGEHVAQTTRPHFLGGLVSGGCLFVAGRRGKIPAVVSTVEECEGLSADRTAVHRGVGLPFGEGDGGTRRRWWLL